MASKKDENRKIQRRSQKAGSVEIEALEQDDPFRIPWWECDAVLLPIADFIGSSWILARQKETAYWESCRGQGMRRNPRPQGHQV
jgi:hypothetical protein